MDDKESGEKPGKLQAIVALIIIGWLSMPLHGLIVGLTVRFYKIAAG